MVSVTGNPGSKRVPAKQKGSKANAAQRRETTDRTPLEDWMRLPFPWKIILPDSLRQQWTRRRKYSRRGSLDHIIVVDNSPCTSQVSAQSGSSEKGNESEPRTVPQGWQSSHRLPRGEGPRKPCSLSRCCLSLSQHSGHLQKSHWGGVSLLFPTCSVQAVWDKQA